jgi:hypothetical protein
MPLHNVYVWARNLLAGRGLASIADYIDPRYPPTKFLRPRSRRIELRCILAGYPRTGTHWIRNVVEKSTGHRAFSLASKPTYEDRDAVLVKVHARNKAIARLKALWLLPAHTFQGRYLYTYRDPRDAILSYYEFHRTAKGDRSLTPEGFLRRYDPVGQYRWELSAWVLRPHPDVKVVRFEDLKADPLGEFQEIFAYLGLDHPVKTEALGQRVGQKDRSNRPRGVALGWKSAPAEYAWLIDTIGSELGKEIRALGYESN